MGFPAQAKSHQAQKERMHVQAAKIAALWRQLEGMQAAASHALRRRRKAQDYAVSADHPAMQRP